jgi:hypothetical protein
MHSILYMSIRNPFRMKLMKVNYNLKRTTNQGFERGEELGLM